MSQNTFGSEMILKVIFCWVFCEKASHYRPSIAEEKNKNNLNKMPNLPKLNKTANKKPELKFHQIGG